METKVVTKAWQNEIGLFITFFTNENIKCRDYVSVLHEQKTFYFRVNNVEVNEVTALLEVTAFEFPRIYIDSYNYDIRTLKYKYVDFVNDHNTVEVLDKRSF